jgi:hypothetical protein
LLSDAWVIAILLKSPLACSAVIALRLPVETPLTVLPAQTTVAEDNAPIAIANILIFIGLVFKKVVIASFGHELTLLSI